MVAQTYSRTHLIVTVSALSRYTVGTSTLRPGTPRADADAATAACRDRYGQRLNPSRQPDSSGAAVAVEGTVVVAVVVVVVVSAAVAEDMMTIVDKAAASAGGARCQ
jgi:hypothetical protein